MGTTWVQKFTVGEGPAWPFLGSLWDTPGLDGGWYLVPVTTKNIFLRLCLPSPKDTKSHRCGSWQHPREESGQCPPKPRLKAHSSTDEKIIWSPQLSVALFNLINRGERGWRPYCWKGKPFTASHPKKANWPCTTEPVLTPFSLFPACHPKMQRNINSVLFLIKCISNLFSQT